MKSICYIIPFFGHLPVNFNLWLISCKVNSTVNWLIYTDDKTSYDYPENVKVKYCEYADILDRFKKHFDFDILIDRPWRLSLFKPAYGEIFQEDIEEYDFWGYCDVDLMWGNIRKFYTDDVLNQYERVGYLGHSTLYKNTSENNSRYRTIVPECTNYIDVFSGKSNYSFDENGMDQIFQYLNIPYYKEVVFAHLTKYESSFFLTRLPEEDRPNNKYQIFTWQNGTLTRHFINKDGEIGEMEFVYLHFWCRPMKYVVKNVSEDTLMYIYPDVMTDKPIGISKHSLKKYGRRSFISFFLNSLWVNRHKITFRRIYNNLNNAFKYKFS